MRHRVGGVLVCLALLAISSASLQAQVFTPVFLSPRVTNDFGASVSDGPGRLSFEGLWRGGPYGLRVGYVDAAGGLLSLGGEFRTPVPVPDAPLGLLFTAAAQGLVGDENLAGIQAGLSAGYTFGAEAAVLTPYLHPRVAVASTLEDTDRFRFEAMADIGLDVEVQQLVVFRLAISFSDIGADWGLALAVRQ